MENNFLDQLDRDKQRAEHQSEEKQSSKILKQSKRRELHCSTFTASLQASALTAGTQALVLFPLGIHLPDKADIGCVYIENRSGCGMNVFEGPGGVGRLIGYSTKQTYRVVVLADSISSVSLVVDATATFGDGLVIATLFSHRWAPKMGTIV